MFKMNYVNCCLLTLCAVSLSNVNANTKNTSEIFVNKDVKHDVSLPLRYLEATPDLLHRPKSYIKNIVNQTSKNTTDLVKESIVPLHGFQGMGVGFPGYEVKSVPAEPNGSIGLIQYLQHVNSDIAVFDKATGQVAPGFPKPSRSLWAGFNNICEFGAAGRVSLKYDQLAHRWVAAQYAYGDFMTGPFYLCVGVSTSEDATGSYNRYAFQLDSYTNYIRLGLWPDAYYVSLNMIGRLSFGPQACALERDKMINGDPASIICKKIEATSTDPTPLIPADLVGYNLPPANNPAYFLGLEDSDGLNIYKFHVNFTNPALSTLSLTNLSVNVYTRACAATGGMACAIQPNTTRRLDVQSSNLMNRVEYRQFDNYGSMVATHTVEGPQPKYAPAVRWYELRVLKDTPSFNPIVYQQATLAPDSKNRFIGSIAIDKAGDIAVGYNVTSSLIYPSMEVGIRNFNDPLNTMTVQPLVTGHGAQTGISLWGSASLMVVDPADGCSFWYTNAYLKDSGNFNWSTYIVNFKLPLCDATEV